MPDVPRPNPPFLHSERSRHGRLAWYVRRGHGARIRLRADYDSDAFWQEYRDALEGKAPETDQKRPPAKGTLEWAIRRYKAGEAWKILAAGTRAQRDAILRQVVSTSGGKPLAVVNRKAVLAGIARRADRPHSANNFVKAMRGFCRWCVAEELLPEDPTAGIAKLAGTNERGFHTWTEEEVERYEARWKLGTRERLALDIMLYTGFRRSDAVTFGRQDLRGWTIHKRTQKTGQTVTIPLLEPLRASIAAAPTGEVLFLVTGRGERFVVESFGNWFRKACRAAGVPGSAHGLRKVSATRAADNGATDKELMAMFGWTDPKMAHHYTRDADRKRLGLGAGAKMLPVRKSYEEVPHLGPGLPAPSAK